MENAGYIEIGGLVINIMLGVVTYLIIGTFVAAVTSGRSYVDLILDVLLWPVILYYAWRHGG